MNSCSQELEETAAKLREKKDSDSAFVCIILTLLANMDSAELAQTFSRIASKY